MTIFIIYIIGGIIGFLYCIVADLIEESKTNTECRKRKDLAGAYLWMVNSALVALLIHTIIEQLK